MTLRKWLIPVCIFLLLPACLPPNKPGSMIRPALTDPGNHTAGYGVIVYDVEIFTSLRYQRFLDSPPFQRWVRDDLSIGFTGGYDKSGGHLPVPASTPGRKKGLFVYSLPPGKYHLVHSDFAGVTFWRGKSEQPREITVHVKAGEVRYVGTLSYRFDITPGAFSIRVKDRFDKVLPILKEHLGGIGSVRKTLARYEDTNFSTAGPR